MTDKPTVTQADIRLHNRLVMSVPEPTREEGRQIIAAHREAAIKEAVGLLHDATCIIGHLVPMDSYVLAGRKLVAKDVWQAAYNFLYGAKGQATPASESLLQADLPPIRIDWNKHDLAEAYDLIEGVRRAAAQNSESPLDSSLRQALDAVEAADCEWDGLTSAKGQADE